MMRRGLVSGILVVCALVLACNVVLAAPPQMPWMGFRGTVTGIPSGCTANIQIVNASGVVSSTSTTSGDWGSPDPLKVFGSSGDTLTVRINGHQVATWSFDDPGAIVSKTLAYPVTASPSPSPSPSATANPPSNGGTTTYGNGAIGGNATATPSPSVTATPTVGPSVTASPTTTATPTPTTAPSQQPSESNFPWWLLLILLAIIVVAAGAYFILRRK